LGNQGYLYRKHKQVRQGSVRVGLAREPCPANSLCTGVSWCAVGFGVDGGDWLYGRIRCLVVVGEAGACVERCRWRRVRCAVFIGVAGGCVLGWLLVFM
jgi:hypothetical protein